MFQPPSHMSSNVSSNPFGPATEQFSEVKQQTTPVKIGEGSYGKVFKIEDGKVTKIVGKYQTINDDCIEDCTIKELCMLSQFSHPGIVKMDSYSEFIDEKEESDDPLHKQKIKINMAYSGISLFEWWDTVKYPQRLKTIKSIVFQILSVLSYLESMDIVHGDLKPTNVLIDPDTKVVKVIDWGASGFLGAMYTSCRCTYSFAAPEILHKFAYNTKIDVFSLGLIVKSIIYKRCDGETEYANNVKTNKIYPLFDEETELPSYVEPEFIELCKSMLTINHKDRPSVKELYENKIFDSLRKETSDQKSEGISTDMIPDYSKKFSNITLRMRGILVDWLYDVHHKFHILAAYPLACWILDNYMSSKASPDTQRKVLQLIGVSCSILAGCIMCDDIPCLREYVRVTDNAFTFNQLLINIWEIGRSLDFSLYNKLFDVNIPDKSISDWKIIKTILVDQENITKTQSEKLELFKKIKTEQNSPAVKTVLNLFKNCSIDSPAGTENSKGVGHPSE